MRLFLGVLCPERLVLAPQICSFQDRIAHSQAHDVVTARQGDGLPYGHKRAIDLLAWSGDVAIDVDRPVFDDSCGEPHPARSLGSPRARPTFAAERPRASPAPPPATSPRLAAFPAAE